MLLIRLCGTVFPLFILPAFCTDLLSDIRLTEVSRHSFLHGGSTNAREIHSPGVSLALCGRYGGTASACSIELGRAIRNQDGHHKMGGTSPAITR